MNLGDYWTSCQLMSCNEFYSIYRMWWWIVSWDKTELTWIYQTDVTLWRILFTLGFYAALLLQRGVGPWMELFYRENLIRSLIENWIESNALVWFIFYFALIIWHFFLHYSTLRLHISHEFSMMNGFKFLSYFVFQLCGNHYYKKRLGFFLNDYFQILNDYLLNYTFFILYIYERT